MPFGKISMTLLREIGTRYGFKNIAWSKKMNGFSALNYLAVADNKPFIVKKYRSTNEQDINRIDRIAFFLNQSSIPVNPPLKNLKNEYHFSLQGNIYAVYPKIIGTVLHEPDFDDHSLGSTASLLAKLHRLSPPENLNLKTTQEIIRTSATLESRAKDLMQRIKESPINPEIDELTKKLLQEKITTISKLDPLITFHPFELKREFVHGDFHNENLLFDYDHRVLKLLDFEETHLGHRIEDVINFILFACCNSGFKTDNLQKARAFYRAYNILYPLSEKELHLGVLFSLFKLVNSFFLEKELYATGDKFFAQLLQRDLKKLTYLREHVDQFTEKLIQ